jgi:hypothetical protein
MAGIRTVYLLDPESALFQAITITVGDESAIINELGCEAVDFFRFDEQHTLFFDDEGLRAGISYYTIVDGFPDPLGGKLLLAADEDEDGAAPHLELREAVVRFHCFRAVMDPIIVSSQSLRDDLVSFVSAVKGFATRIEPVDIEVIDHHSPRV